MPIFPPTDSFPSCRAVSFSATGQDQSSSSSPRAKDSDCLGTVVVVVAAAVAVAEEEEVMAAPMLFFRSCTTPGDFGVMGCHLGPLEVALPLPLLLGPTPAERASPSPSSPLLLSSAATVSRDDLCFSDRGCMVMLPAAETEEAYSPEPELSCNSNSPKSSSSVYRASVISPLSRIGIASPERLDRIVSRTVDFRGGDPVGTLLPRPLQRPLPLGHRRR